MGRPLCQIQESQRLNIFRIEVGMMYITNKYDSIRLPYSEELLEWLIETYPFSKYVVVE
jgi:hypothetical protein